MMVLSTAGGVVSVDATSTFKCCTAVPCGKCVFAVGRFCEGAGSVVEKNAARERESLYTALAVVGDVLLALATSCLMHTKTSFRVDQCAGLHNAGATD